MSWTGTLRRTIGRGRWRLAVLVAAGLGAASWGGAQTATRQVRLDSGLHTFFGGRSVLVTVAEVGNRSASSSVRIVVYDDAEQALARTTGVLRLGAPVRLELPIERGAGRVQVRVAIWIASEEGGGSAPVATVEDVDPGSLTVVPRVLCGMPVGRTGPVTSALCDGFVVTTLTAGR